MLWSELQLSLKNLLLSIPYENNSEADIVLLPQYSVIYKECLRSWFRFTLKLLSIIKLWQPSRQQFFLFSKVNCRVFCVFLSFEQTFQNKLVSLLNGNDYLCLSASWKKKKQPLKSPSLTDIVCLYSSIMWLWIWFVVNNQSVQ